MKKILLLSSVLILSGILFSCQAEREERQSAPNYFKGFSIDAARTVEDMDHYFRMVDFSVEWGFNCLVFRLTDDEGSSLKFKTHPELKTHPGAFTSVELKALVKYASDKGIEMIPEVESFGHTKYITETERYSFLEDILDPSITWANGICPVSDSTLQLMKDLYSEVAEIFPSQYLHIGCDETNWGGNEMTRKALEEKSKIEIWAEYVNQLNGFVKELGKRSIIWGDVPIREDQELLGMLDKDIVIMDWNYWLTDEQKIAGNAIKMMENGFDIIGAPAVNWMMWGPRVGESQFGNIEAFRSVYNKITSKKNKGVIITHWCPYRYLQNGQWDSYARAADILNSDSSSAEATLKHFTEQHFGSPWNKDWRKIYEQLYHLTPKNKYHGEDVGITGFYPWRNHEDMEEILMRTGPLEISFSETVELLKKQEDRIQRNRGDFQELLLTAQYLEHMIWRDNRVFSLKSSGEEAETVVAEIAMKDVQMLDQLRTTWKNGRTGKMSENHIWEFPRAAAFSARLAEDQEEMKILMENIEK